MEIKAAGDNILYFTAPGILLALVCNTDGVGRKVTLPVVLVPESRMHLFSSVPADQKDDMIVITKSGPYLGLGSFSVQLSRYDNMDHLDLAIAKERTKPKSILSPI